MQNKWLDLDCCLLRRLIQNLSVIKSRLKKTSETISTQVSYYQNNLNKNSVTPRSVDQ